MPWLTCAQRRQAQAQAGAVLDHLMGIGPQRLQQVVCHCLPVVGVDQAQRVQRASLAVGTAVGCGAGRGGAQSRLVGL